MIRCYQDFEGNTICSDDVIFPEDSIDYIKNDWYKDSERLYIEILRENTDFYNSNIKGIF